MTHSLMRMRPLEPVLQPCNHMLLCVHCALVLCQTATVSYHPMQQAIRLAKQGVRKEPSKTYERINNADR